MKKLSQNLTLKNLIPAIIAFLVLVSLPDLITWKTLPEGLVFNGFFVNLDDANVYLAAIRQGREGSWLYTSQHTSELLPGIISYMPYLLTGKLQSLFGGNELLWYQILRYSAGMFAFYSLTILAREFLPNKPQVQKTSFMMLLFGSGISWLLIGAGEQIPTYAADLLTPEWTLVTSFMSAPHFLLGIGSQAIWFALIQQLLQHPKKTLLLKGFLTSLLLSLTYPFLIPVNGLVLALYLGFEIIEKRSVPWKKISDLLIVSTPMLGFLLYYGIYIPNTPELAKTLLTNNRIDPPSLAGILVGFGLLLFMAIFGVKKFTAAGSDRLLLFWIGCTLLCLYLPINFSGRFVLGLFIPVSLLAAEGVENILSGPGNSKRLMKSLPEPTLRRILYLLTVPSTILFIIWTVAAPQATKGFPFYYQDAEIAAVQWLAEHTTREDVVLADYPISNLIPRYSQARVFIGHLNLTIDLDAKQDDLIRFWDPETPNSWRSEFIKKWGVTYLYYGSFEKNYSAGAFTPSGSLVYAQDGIEIYSILP